MLLSPPTTEKFALTLIAALRALLRLEHSLLLSLQSVAFSRVVCQVVWDTWRRVVVDIAVISSHKSTAGENSWCDHHIIVDLFTFGFSRSAIGAGDSKASIPPSPSALSYPGYVIAFHRKIVRRVRTVLVSFAWTRIDIRVFFFPSCTWTCTSCRRKSTDRACSDFPSSSRACRASQTSPCTRKSGASCPGFWAPCPRSNPLGRITRKTGLSRVSNFAAYSRCVLSTAGHCCITIVVDVSRRFALIHLHATRFQWIRTVSCLPKLLQWVLRRALVKDAFCQIWHCEDSTQHVTVICMLPGRPWYWRCISWWFGHQMCCLGFESEWKDQVFVRR